MKSWQGWDKKVSALLGGGMKKAVSPQLSAKPNEPELWRVIAGGAILVLIGPR